MFRRARGCLNRVFARSARAGPTMITSSSHRWSRVTLLTATALTLAVYSHENNQIHAEDRAINSKKWLAKAMCTAARRNDVKAMEKLLHEQRDAVNLRHPLGWTPLHIAAANGNLESVKWLLANGAKIDDTDTYKLTRRHSIEQLQERKDFHNQINPSVSCSGWSPLHYAVAFQHEDVVQALLDAGADMSLTNADGNDPLNVIDWEMLGKGSEIQAPFERMFEAASTKREAVRKEEERLARLAHPLETRLRDLMVGQVWPILSVSGAIRRRDNGWHNEKPLVLMFVGASGTGKTMLAKSLAAELHKGREDSFIRIDMSEFATKHEMAKLIGAPAGYVGYEAGGALTNKLQKCPDAVVLLDEVEKAHPDVLSLMLQVFDEGRITDGASTTISCPNAVFIMTSNLVQSEIGEAISSGRYQLRPDTVDEVLMKEKAKLRARTPTKDFVDVPAIGLGKNISPDAISVVASSMHKFIREVVNPILKRHFLRDEFIGRINEVVVFHPLSEVDLEASVTMELSRWKNKALQRHNIQLNWTPQLIHSLTKSYNERYGFRSLIYGCEKQIVSLLASAHEQRIINAGDRVELDVEFAETDAENNQVVIRSIVPNAVPTNQRTGWLKMFT